MASCLKLFETSNRKTKTSPLSLVPRTVNPLSIHLVRMREAHAFARVPSSAASLCSAAGVWTSAGARSFRRSAGLRTSAGACSFCLSPPPAPTERTGNVSGGQKRQSLPACEKEDFTALSLEVKLFCLWGDVAGAERAGPRFR